MSDLLSIGASGVRAYQTALTTVSENIANTGVAGYTRRTTDVSQVSGGATRTGSAMNGNGVVVTGITRNADAYRSQAVRASNADLSRTTTGSTYLTTIQSALTDTKLSDRLTSFYNAANSLASDPTSTAARSTMLEAGTTVASAFTATGQALDDAMAQLDASAGQDTQTLNALGTALAKVNDGLARAQSGSSSAATLGDQRDQLLEQMSAISDITVATDDIGRATVRIGNQAGPVLVAGATSGQLSYARNTDGAVSFAVTRAGTVSVATPAGGSLAGVVDGAQRIADARAATNDIASGFVTQINAVQAQGRDLDGRPGAAMFATGATPTDMSVTLTDPRGIAAAGAGGGTRDASNLAALQTARTSGGLEDATTSLVVANAASIAQRKLVGDAQSAIHDGAVSSRDSVSGVNLDNEAVDLLRFQQAYSASSRVIQTARDTLQTILDIR